MEIKKETQNSTYKPYDAIRYNGTNEHLGKYEMQDEERKESQTGTNR